MADAAPARHARIAQQVARGSAIALGASIPVSVALDGVLLALFAAAWALAGDWRAKLEALRANPVALAALALFALLAAGTLYGDRYPGDGAFYLGKYSDLLFIAPLAWVFGCERTRRLALLALAGALALTLALSYAIAFGWLAAAPPFTATEGAPTVFKKYLTQNILLAFGAFLFAELARVSAGRARLLWAALAVLAALNVLLIVPGRTGHGILLLLLLYWSYAWRGWRGAASAALALGVLLAGLAAVPSSLRERIALFGAEIAALRAGASGAETSSGLRWSFYRTSLAIIAEHPLAGVGTGGFPKAYAEKARATDVPTARNPHNEYLHLAVQLGAPGLALFLLLLAVQWRCAARLALYHERHLARALVLAIAAGCLLNSLLLDHTEGLLYAWLTGVLYGGLQSRDDSQPGLRAPRA
jgi:O-antigen ligase